MNIAQKFFILAVAVITAFLATPDSKASSVPQLAVTTDYGAASVECYFAQQTAPRPAVVILHGRQGLQPLHTFYQRVASTLAQNGFNAYLVDYYSGDDSKLANNPDAEARKAFFAGRVRGWSHMVSSVITTLQADSRNSDRLALLGFSQGGFLAAAAAGFDNRPDVLCVFYGGIPDAVKAEISRLPPLLEFHGDADHTVPLQSGKNLVNWAKSLGGNARMVIYPGAGHGFSPKDSEDALKKFSEFFDAQGK